MLDKADRHLKGFAAQNPVARPHPKSQATGLVLPSVMVFKIHAATVHKIFLRA